MDNSLYDMSHMDFNKHSWVLTCARFSNRQEETEISSSFSPWNHSLCTSRTPQVSQLVKNPHVTAGDSGDVVMKIHRRKKWQPTPVFLPGKFQGQRSLVGHSQWDSKESDMTENNEFVRYCSKAERKPENGVRSNSVF